MSDSAKRLENETSHGGTVNVLIVDDDSKNLVALESILDDGPYSLIKAQTGAEALMALMNDEFAAIVLDVRLPDMSGIDLARLIKQRKRTQHIPIIFLTAHFREDEHAVLGYDAGAVDYLTKPVNSSVLKSKVNVFVDLFRKTRALAAMNRTMEEAEEALRVANAELASRNAALEREAEERDRRIRAESAQAEAEEANAAKDRFLAMLSHELRTPLSPIIHSVALLEEQECAPHVREAMLTIRRNVQLEARLIDDLLDLARVRNGKLRVELRPTDMHDALHQAVEICRADIEGRKIRLVEKLKAGQTHMQGDPARLQQVFWNLLSNAAKFTPEGGTITVSTSGPNGSGEILASVTDTGVGIAPGKLTQIFDAFEQASTFSSAGLGLGLAICKALVERHGGRIEAHSDGVNCGATFSIHLPCTDVALEEMAPAPSDSGSATGLRLLLVEDHRDTLDTLERLLLRKGYVVRTAGSVSQALKVAEDFEFDMLISDIGLPDARGTELVTRLNERAGQAIAAIAMSGFGTVDDLERSRNAGFSAHLTKPVEFGSLHRMIAQLAKARALAGKS